MKIFDIRKSSPDLRRLLAAVQRDDILFVRQGHSIARLERFTDEDWEDWSFEHDPKAIRQAEAARQRLDRGEGKPLGQVAKELGLHRVRRPGGTRRRRTAKVS